MASCFYTNFVPTLLHALFVFQALEFCYSHALTNVSCIDAEREALLNFKQDVIDPSRNLSSWTGKRCCEWEGVKCNHGTSHVLQLNLIGRGLGGRIPSTIGQLASLRYLDLSYNNLSGNIPESIGQLRNLELMHFGPIPSTIRQLSSLRLLDLSSNNLSENIPKSIGQLSNLELIDFNNNRLDGVVNELHLANLTSLTKLSFGWNELVMNVKFEAKDLDKEPEEKESEDEYLEENPDDDLKSDLDED
ncbi:receptor-like protein EIX2 [Eucalyptus grandis]|uniref:receptor-like protein EIX2 n=1 Tax=Eucalyptus grandis TaxID=71139 RepID=UPI00192E7BDC|nr:receptor-like protein EIX2 [Eucalyptus grandis]